jgi:hypothetical protein
MHEAGEGVLRRQKLNAHTVAVLVVLGFGSITYGYTASIIGTTLGMWTSASHHQANATQASLPSSNISSSTLAPMALTSSPR